MAAIQYRGTHAVTNFNISNYVERLKKRGVVHIDEPRPLATPADPPKSQETQHAVVHDDLKPQAPLKREKPEQPVLRYSDDLDLGTPPSCMDMDSADDREHDAPWSFSMDVIGLNLLPVPDLTFEKGGELPDLFGEQGFEDDIDLIFGGGGGDGGVVEGSSDGQGMLLLCERSSPSPSSSTTSVSFDYTTV